MGGERTLVCVVEFSTYEFAEGTSVHDGGGVRTARACAPGRGPTGQIYTHNFRRFHRIALSGSSCCGSQGRAAEGGQSSGRGRGTSSIRGCQTDRV